MNLYCHIQNLIQNDSKVVGVAVAEEASFIPDDQLKEIIDIPEVGVKDAERIITGINNTETRSEVQEELDLVKLRELYKTCENISKDSVFLIDCEPYLISLIYYLDNDYNFYSPLRAKYIKYVKWDNLSSKIINNQALSDFIAYYKETKNIKSNIYFIQTYDEEKIKERNGINKNLNNNFKQIFESGFIVENREGYKIFRYIK